MQQSVVARSISAKAFLPFPLLQVLLFHDQNYGIHYEYTIPVNQSSENQSEPAKPQDALFLWTHSGWEGCSVQCGGGKVGVGEAREQLGSRNPEFRALCTSPPSKEIENLCFHRDLSPEDLSRACGQAIPAPTGVLAGALHSLA